MDVKNYLERAETIRKNELMSVMDLADQLDIAFNTLKRIKTHPDACALKTMKKLKMFVEKWEDKNMSVSH